METKYLNKVKFYVIQLFTTTFAIIFAAWLLQKGIHIESPKLITGIVVAVVLLLVNMFVRPILIVLTVPITISTFGIFLLVINALTIMIVDFFVEKFIVDSFGWALLFSLIVSATTSIMETISKTKIIRIHRDNNTKDDDNGFSDYEEI